MAGYRVRTLFVAVFLAAVVLIAPTQPAAAQSPPPPRVMASTGDSITRAFNVDWCCFLRDSPSRSWSTGTNATVNSHYRRLQLFASQPVTAFNDARSGARMAELAGQLSTAATQGADYVTVLMGANDVCTSSVSTMTPTSTFETQFRQALSGFTAARPEAMVFVASIPDVHHLWELLHSNAWAAFVWDTFHICQSMLSRTNTDAMRQQVVDRLQSFNDTLALVCAEFTQCRWDGYAVYSVEFAPGDVSPIDYFHPSTQGQRRLADVTWTASYWS